MWRVIRRFLGGAAPFCGEFLVRTLQHVGEAVWAANSPAFRQEADVTRRRDPFMLALDHIRERAGAGRYAPGQPVVIVDEARRLGLSTTPVREALAWLCGEGLIERAPQGGFLAPRLDAAVVRDRFAFRLHCVATSLDIIAEEGADLAASLTGASGLTMADRLDILVRSAGNQVLFNAFERIGRQLLSLASAERKLFPDLAEEAFAVARLFEGGSLPPLRMALVGYHQRRMDAAPLLILEREAENLRPAKGAGT